VQVVPEVRASVRQASTVWDARMALVVGVACAVPSRDVSHSW
jgi:hypothetical protein